MSNSKIWQFSFMLYILCIPAYIFATVNQNSISYIGYRSVHYV